MQPINAEVYTQLLTKTLGGEPALVPPTRDIYDEVLEVAALIYDPEGKKPSRWSSTNEFIEFAERYARSDHCFGMGDISGLTFETPFGSDSALIMMKSGESHPQLGSGLLVAMKTPYSASDQEIADAVANLNYLESILWTDFPQLGCWHSIEVDGSEFRLSHSTFIPNALFLNGLATNLAFWSLARARWAREQLWPSLKDLPMHEILRKRLEPGDQ